MSYTGEVRTGMIVLDGGAQLPEGMRVHVELIESPAASRDRGDWAAELLKLAGRAEGLPPDFARNHDHYLCGTPKK